MDEGHRLKNAGCKLNAELKLYRAGHRLREVEIAAALKTSRTPVRDAIRRLEADELGIPDGAASSGAVGQQRRAPIVGRSNEGKPGTRKTRYGKTRYKRMGGKP